MPRIHTDIEMSHQVFDMNREFLRLLTHPRRADASDLLGFDVGAGEALQRLDERQLDMIARAPLLLVEFSPFPGFGEIREISPRLNHFSSSWQQQLKSFTDRLLACIWQSSRHDRLATALYTGIDSDRCRRLSEMSFCRLSRSSEQAARALRVRLGQHPVFWPDLIRLVQQGNRTQRIISRMSAIQLSVAQEWLKSVRPSNPRYI
ncbi:MAG: hypothetical protein ACR2QG_11460 [Gammaproteobacteria bacterium]